MEAAAAAVAVAVKGEKSFTFTFNFHFHTHSQSVRQMESWCPLPPSIICANGLYRSIDGVLASRFDTENVETLYIKKSTTALHNRLPAAAAALLL